MRKAKIKCQKAISTKSYKITKTKGESKWLLHDLRLPPQGICT